MEVKLAAHGTGPWDGAVEGQDARTHARTHARTRSHARVRALTRAFMCRLGSGHAQVADDATMQWPPLCLCSLKNGASWMRVVFRGVLMAGKCNPVWYTSGTILDADPELFTTGVP